MSEVIYSSFSLKYNLCAPCGDKIIRLNTQKSCLKKIKKVPRIRVDRLNKPPIHSPFP